MGLEHLEYSSAPSYQGSGSAEWFRPRDRHTGDRSGFDIAAYLRLQSGERLLVSIDVKYADTFSPGNLGDG